MAEKQFPWKNGTYRVDGTYFSSMATINGSKVTSRHGGIFSAELVIKEETIDKAVQEIVGTTGQKFYNVEMRWSLFNIDIVDLGIVSEDGLKITMKTGFGIVTYDWISEEEAALVDQVGDPIEAPPHHYKIQPGNVGKIVWITGPSGVTQLLREEKFFS